MRKVDEVAYQCCDSECRSNKEKLVQLNEQELRDFLYEKMKARPWKMIGASLVPLPFNIAFNAWPWVLAIHGGMIVLSILLCHSLNKSLRK